MSIQQTIVAILKSYKASTKRSEQLALENDLISLFNNSVSVEEHNAIVVQQTAIVEQYNAVVEQLKSAEGQIKNLKETRSKIIADTTRLQDEITCLQKAKNDLHDHLLQANNLAELSMIAAEDNLREIEKLKVENNRLLSEIVSLKSSKTAPTFEFGKGDYDFKIFKPVFDTVRGPATATVPVTDVPAVVPATATVPATDDTPAEDSVPTLDPAEALGKALELMGAIEEKTPSVEESEALADAYEEKAKAAAKDASKLTEIITLGETPAPVAPVKAATVTKSVLHSLGKIFEEAADELN